MKLSFPNYNPDVTSPLNTVDVFVDLLGDLDAVTLKTAVKSCCAEPGRAFAPSAGEIRGMVSSLRAKISGVPTAGEAWGEIIKSFERMPGGNMAGGGHTPILDHPLVKKAVYCMGGYTAIGVDYFDNIMANRAHFFRIYADLLEHFEDESTELPALTEYVQAQKEIDISIKMLTDRLTPAGERSEIRQQERARAMNRGE
jgi:hypothetical protein